MISGGNASARELSEVLAWATRRPLDGETAPVDRRPQAPDPEEGRRDNRALPSLPHLGSLLSQAPKHQRL